MFSFFWAIFDILALSIATLLGVFLYWRSAKRELVDSQLIFDTFAIFAAGLIFGRLTDFLIRNDFYNWSFKKLVFFNAYGGFDLLGAFLGGLATVYFFVRNKKQNFWFVFDLAASAFAFGAFIYNVFELIQQRFLVGNKEILSSNLYLAVGYFLIFWALKRFEKKKKHKGFYACFFLVTFSVLNVAVLILERGISRIGFNYQLILLFTLGTASFIYWYVLARRKIFIDLKNFFGMTVLSIFKIRRVATSVREANSMSKAIVLSPLYLAKVVVNLVKYIGREIYLSVVDLLSAFGFLK